MRISDWSSDVCSSDLLQDVAFPRRVRHGFAYVARQYPPASRTCQRRRGPARAGGAAHFGPKNVNSREGLSMSQMKVLLADSAITAVSANADTAATLVAVVQQCFDWCCVSTGVTRL